MGKGWIAAFFCCLALVLGSVAAGCGSGDGGSSATANTDATVSAEEGSVTTTENGENEVSEIKAVAKRSKPKVVVPGGPPPKQLVVKDLIEGTGAEAKEGGRIEINYVGVTYKDGKEFENTYDTHDTLYWRIGSHEVIRGWEQGIRGMKVGGRRELIVPPRLGFKPGQQSHVAPQETLVYVIDVIKAETAPNAPASLLDSSKEG